MADTTIFRAVNWTPNEQIGESKMDLMADNSEWLFRNTPRAIYTLPGGIRRVEGVRIASGRVIIPKNDQKDSATAEVRFGNFFSARCEPNVTTGLISRIQPRIFCTVRGIGKVVPDARGFEVQVNVDALQKKNDKIAATLYVGFIAMGY